MKREKAKATQIANKEKRAKNIYNYALQFYEKGNQSKSWANVWRNKIVDKYGLCYRSFLTYKNLGKKLAQNDLNKERKD